VVTPVLSVESDTARHRVDAEAGLMVPIVDGADAARFTNTLRELLEELSLLLMV